MMQQPPASFSPESDQSPVAAIDPALAWMARESPFTRWLERWRNFFFIALALLIVSGFNGQWRIGLDSAVYRGIAENLAGGRGYTFAGLSHTQVYPGCRS